MANKSESGTPKPQLEERSYKGPVTGIIYFKETPTIEDWDKFKGNKTIGYIDNKTPGAINPQSPGELVGLFHRQQVEGGTFVTYNRNESEAGIDGSYRSQDATRGVGSESDTPKKPTHQIVAETLSIMRQIDKGTYIIPSSPTANKGEDE